jgi:hypothetical protein
MAILALLMAQWLYWRFWWCNSYTGAFGGAIGTFRVGCLLLIASTSLPDHWLQKFQQPMIGQGGTSNKQ